MATNLQLDNSINDTPQPLKDQDQNSSQLHLTTNGVAVGLGAPTESGLSVFQVPAPNRAHIQFGDPNATPSAASAKLSFGGAGIEHAGFAWVPDGQLSNGKLHLTFGGRDDPTPRSAQPARVTFQANGNVGVGTMAPEAILHVKGSSGGSPSRIILENGSGHQFFLNTFSSRNRFSIGRVGVADDIAIDSNGNVGIGVDAATEKLEVNGNILATGDVILTTGDIRLTGADCAEEFDVENDEAIEPGMVIVIGDDERLQRCTRAYDRAVAGVVSGAGGYRPGIVLGSVVSNEKRVRLALTGRVYCRVDASYSPIAIGDLLTTSPAPGHAMKACDSVRAFGAVIGKALRPLDDGAGLIPILVALQ